MVGVTVGKQDDRDGTLGRQRCQVALIERTGVDDDAVGAPGSRSTQELVPSRVIGPGLGASTTEAVAVTWRTTAPSLGQRGGIAGVAREQEGDVVGGVHDELG